MDESKSIFSMSPTIVWGHKNYVIALNQKIHHTLGGLSINNLQLLLYEELLLYHNYRIHTSINIYTSWQQVLILHNKHKESYQHLFITMATGQSDSLTEE